MRLPGLVFFILVPIITFSQVDLNNGLIAYYPFNGNANDASGNGNNPIFNNATLTSDYYGKANSAYHFNGVDNYIEVPNSNSLNTGNAISICAWVKPTGFYYGPCHGNNVLMKGNTDSDSGIYFIRFDDALYTGTNCRVEIPDTIHQTYYGSSIGLSPIQDTPFAQKNIWHSVVYTYDGIDARLYIDCNLILDTKVSGLNFTNTSDLFLGRLNDINFPYWLNGDLDEVRIYNRPLNADEVKTYSFGCAKVEPCSNWAQFAGVDPNDPGVQIGDLDIPGNKVTVEALFNRTDSYDPGSYGGDIVSKHTDPTDVNYLLRPTRAEITTTTGWHSTPDVCNFSLNKTYHVAMVYDGETLKFYRNGFLMSQTPCTGDMILNNWITTIGSTAAPSDHNPTQFHGYINEVRIWNTARTQSEINTHMNQPLSNPATQTGLLAYYTFDNLKNKQGNSQWDGSLLNDGTINQTNPECSFVADSCGYKPQNVTAGFTSPDTVCIGKSLQFVNTSQNASNYYWNFCAADFNTTPDASNLSNPGNTLNAPVFMDYILDDNKNYYGFVSNHLNGHLIRLNYGVSLLNTPAAEDLGNIDAIPNYAEGIQTEKLNGKCYVFIVSGGDVNGSSSVLLRIDFGNSFANTPTGINLGNIGNLNYPHDLFITQENGNYYGFTANINDNTITRFDFGDDLSNTPAGINLGDIGDLNYPCGFSFINLNGNWYAFITNRNNNSVSRLDFGNALTNLPTGLNVGNPGNFLNNPRDISLFESCSGIIGLIVNEENEQTGTITKLNFNSDITSSPSAKDLGNIGGIVFPHSITKFFLEGNDIYSFIPNVTTSTLTRIRYVGCNSSSIPSSTLQTPPSVSYSQPGVYNVNLLVDIGLPTETSFCKQIVVKKCDSCTLKVSAGKDVSICYKDSTQLNAAGAISYNWKTSTALSDTTILNPVAEPLITTEFVVTGYDSNKTCSSKDTVKVSVLPLPVFTLSNDTSICSGSTLQLYAISNNYYHYHWFPPNYLSDTAIANPTSNPADTIKYFVTANDSENCRSTDSVQINVVPKPIVSTINDTSFCIGTNVSLITNATNANNFIWSPSSGLNSSTIQSPQATPTSSTLYTVIASNVLCSVKDSVRLTVFSLPNVSAGSDTIICTAGIAHLHASGAINFFWYPDLNISDINSANPFATPSGTTTYYVKGTDKNNCINFDSVIVLWHENPVFSITPQDSSICSGKSITLTASGGDIYSWSPVRSLSDSTSAKTSAHPTTTTQYSVHIYDSTCKTSNTLNSTIAVKSMPDITVTKSNDIDCSDLTARLNASGGNSYSWTPTTYIDNPQIANPVVNPLSNTTYVVTVTNTDNCVAQASILINSSVGNMGFYVANAFTPNGDGLNDCFGLRYWGTPATFDMEIFDKWGMQVYHSKNINECWDGTYKGRKQGSGVYVYIITATSICTHNNVFRKGTVVLIR